MSMNEKQTFDYIWQVAVSPSIKYCISGMDSDTQSQLGFKCRDLSKYKRDLGEMFIHKREWLKKKYLPEKGEDARLDFHKISALLCRCIVGNKAFTLNKHAAEDLFMKTKESETLSIDEKIHWEIDHVYVNYKMAFWASVGIIYVNMVSWAYKQIKEAENLKESTEDDISKNKLQGIINIYSGFLRCLEQEKSLYLYEKSPDHDDFCTSMIVALMKNDVLLRDFDYLTYAASMFQWQEYTKLRVFSKILLDPSCNFGYGITDIDSFMQKEISSFALV